MIRRDRPQPRREQCSTRIRQLIDMHAQLQTELLCRSQNLFGIGQIEIAPLAKDVAALS